MNLLVVIAGPTAVGKTAFSIELAEALGTEIISCDSRQFFKEISIGTAKPSADQLKRVKHHFINTLSIRDYYNAARFENEALELLDQLFLKHRVVIACGGSGLYINALCSGIDELPDPDPVTREHIKRQYTASGLDYLRSTLAKLDPGYFKRVDKSNPNRMMRAIEVSLIAGRPYSELLRHACKPRPFRILKLALDLPRTELFESIARRTTGMVEQGLVEECRMMESFRYLNALNTVGYKEMFRYIDGEITLEQAITDIITNTRRYAKRQLTWFRKDREYTWLHPSEVGKALELIMLNL